MLPWKSIINIDSKLKRPIYLQIADSLTNEIVNGRIKQGLKLPGSRAFAEELKINRKTVLQAFDELIAQGWIEILPAKGTFVKKTLPIIKAKSLKKTTNDTNTKQRINEHFEHVITDGIPDYRLAPIDLLLKTARSLSKGIIGKNLLTGNHLYGEETLRSTLVDYLSSSRAIHGSEDNILITRGSQMGIWLTFSHLISPGDRVIVGEFNYSAANSTILAVGGLLTKVKVNKHGLDLDEVESIVKNQSIKAIYISPHHHYPTTVTMPAANRLRLMELAEAYDFFIVEDDYDYDYHYSGSPILPLASIDVHSRVVYLGSFSKVLAPSIRIGYIQAAEGFIEACANIRRQIDRRGDPVIERALAEMIKDNEIQRSLKKAVRQYKIRRDLFCKILKERFADLLDFDTPEGGMAVWVRFKHIRIIEVIDRCNTHGLLLDVDHYEDSNCCRLGFASLNEKEIVTTLSILEKSARHPS